MVKKAGRPKKCLWCQKVKTWLFGKPQKAKAAKNSLAKAGSAKVIHVKGYVRSDGRRVAPFSYIQTASHGKSKASRDKKLKQLLAPARSEVMLSTVEATPAKADPAIGGAN